MNEETKKEFEEIMREAKSLISDMNETIHYEFCGSSGHHPVCKEVSGRKWLDRVNEFEKRVVGFVLKKK